MSWAGLNSWFMVRPQPVISSGPNLPPRPWVKTDSGTPPPRQLTAGSDLNRTAEGPWLTLIDAGSIDYHDNAGWTPNTLANPRNINVRGNYGEVTSVANFNSRKWAFPFTNERPEIAFLPGPIPNPHRPMWNNLVPIVYGLRVTNPTQVKASQSARFNPASRYSASAGSYNEAASLNPSGASMQEVLL